MGFFAPLALLFLIPVGGIITVLYLLRLRRRDVVVSSVMLWAAALQEAQANAPFQKLRRSLLFFLQLLAALLLVAAVARPFVWSKGLGGKATALVLDGSASMKATDVPGERFAEAVQQARSLIANKAAGDAVTIVLAGEKPTTVSPLTADKEKLLASLNAVKPADVTPDMREAISFAGSLVSSRAGAQVTVLTDGAFGRLDEIALGGPHLNFLIIGKRGENVGVTAFDVRDAYAGGVGRQAFVTVQNFSAKARTFPLELTLDEKLLDAHEITLQPGESKSETFDRLKADEGGVLQARMDTTDDLAADNAAYAILAPRRTIKVLLVTAGNPFLERGLNADAKVTVDKVAPEAYRTADSAEHSLTVFDDAAPPTSLPPGRYLFWGPKTLNAQAPVTAANAPDADRPQILDWNRTHPLMRFVDMANVRLLRAKAVTPAPWATTLTESENGPLIIAGERGANRAIFVAFAPLESDMPLRVAFPIFLSNALRWLTANSGDSGGVTRPGEIITLASPNAGAMTITRPDGGRDTLTVAAGRPAIYSKTDTVGVYTARSQGFSQPFAVSLLSVVESNVAPIVRPAVTVTDVAKVETERAGPAGSRLPGLLARRELWPFIILFALLVLGVEWIVYHRRL